MAGRKKRFDNIMRSRYVVKIYHSSSLSSSSFSSFTMARGTPFYLKEPFVKSIKKRPSLVKREIARVFNNDPEGEGERLPYQVTRWTLALIGIGVLLPTAVAAPGALKGIQWIVEAIRESSSPYAKRIARYQYLKRTIERLHQQGFIKVAKKNRKEKVILTEKGVLRFMGYAIEDLAIPEQEKWDKVWRVVAFDIPETRKNAREALRGKLQDLGFLQLQKSFFVYPYPCREEIDYLIEIFNTWEFVTFFETQSLERQEPEARRHFGLL